jgi:hypothetical protein
MWHRVWEHLGPIDVRAWLAMIGALLLFIFWQRREMNLKIKLLEEELRRKESRLYIPSSDEIDRIFWHAPTIVFQILFLVWSTYGKRYGIFSRERGENLRTDLRPCSRRLSL